MGRIWLLVDYQPAMHKQQFICLVSNYAHLYSNIQPYRSDQALALQNTGRKQATQDTDLYEDFH